MPVDWKGAQGRLLPIAPNSGELSSQSELVVDSESLNSPPASLFSPASVNATSRVVALTPSEIANAFSLRGDRARLAARRSPRDGGGKLKLTPPIRLTETRKPFGGSVWPSADPLSLAEAKPGVRMNSA